MFRLTSTMALVVGVLFLRCAIIDPVDEPRDAGSDAAHSDADIRADGDTPRDSGGDADTDADEDRLDGDDDAPSPDADADLDDDLDDSGGDSDADLDEDADEPEGGPLDPDLALPDPSGTPCTTPGSMGECPGIEVCRFYTTVEGRCESCEPCGNLNDSCTASSECDILFMCYMGRCTNFCELGTYMCGPIDDCIDVGHPTYGVCLPF